MYFPIGWPKTINLSTNYGQDIIHICCDGIKILIAFVTNDIVGIWYAKPLIPITLHRRSQKSITEFGSNRHVVWKPDSSKLAVITDKGCIIIYQIEVDVNANVVLNQVDSPLNNLKRDSAELFIKEVIPRLYLKEICNIALDENITALLCISLNEIMVSTTRSQMIKLQWDNFESNENTIDLRLITFYSNESSNNVKNIPSLHDSNSYIKTMDYSPLIGGFAVVLNDCRAAFLSAMRLKFEQEHIKGFWIPDISDATCCSINHKYRLLSFGRHNSEVSIYSVDDNTGGLEFSHKLSLNSKLFSSSLGAVNELKWSPDGCVIVVSWTSGGISLWSTFGTLLMSSLSWDFGLNIDLSKNDPLTIKKMEWSTEGYQLFMIKDRSNVESSVPSDTNILQMDFVKSTLSMNPCMASNSHILLQSDDTLYINQGNNLETIYFGSKLTFPNSQEIQHTVENLEIVQSSDISSILSQSKYWTIIQLPLLYSSTNWPIRYSAIDVKGIYIAVAGRTGLAHYSVITKKWKLFGNETQEKDFVVTGGLLWWNDFIVLGCFSLIDRADEIRTYPRDTKLDNQYCTKVALKAPVILLNYCKDQLICLTADGIVNIFSIAIKIEDILEISPIVQIDIRRICIHPACIVSLTITNLKTDLPAKPVINAMPETLIVNISGRILMIQRELKTNIINSSNATCLASCVECFWLPQSMKGHMKDSLWLYSGAQGMRVWLPVLPPDEDMQTRYRRHTFMSKRIMLSFPLKIYPLVILFKNVIVLGAENDTCVFTNDPNSHFSLPFCVLERRSQVYLHKILRQLIKRNLGYSAWEIAKSCKDLPYFPHSLELLLHEVLEEEATSKDPIPDALLPSILDFIREFPVYLQTIVQCARKTEIALWPYLFSMAGKPKELFQQCLDIGELGTAASYLIILQNLEPSSVSKEFATLLLDVALEKMEWDLAKDLIRFLKAIDPNEVDSPRASFIINNKIAPNQQTQVNSDPEVFNLILGPIARERSFSTTLPSASISKSGNCQSGKIREKNVREDYPAQRRKSEQSISKEKSEIFFIETIIQRHACELIRTNKLIELGYMSAFLDFHLVSWLSQENDRVGKIENFVETLVQLHTELKLPLPLNDAKCIDTFSDLESIQKSVFFGDVCRNASTHTSESGYFSFTQGDKHDNYLNNLNSAYINVIREDDDDQSYINENACTVSYDRFNCPSIPIQTGNYIKNFRQDVFADKLEVKLRYLLQLFIEANCIDYSLTISIILLDAASIGRIINFAIRSDSNVFCNRIQNALRCITQWSFQERSGYRLFMMSLQPQLFMLDQYISQRIKPTVIKEETNTTELIVDDDVREELILSSTNPSKQPTYWTDSEHYTDNYSPSTTNESIKRKDSIPMLNDAEYSTKNNVCVVM